MKRKEKHCNRSHLLHFYTCKLLLQIQRYKIASTMVAWADYALSNKELTSGEKILGYSIQI